MIELRLLEAFVTVVEEGHVTRAAERLGMRQPPLTRLIQGLEARLGCRLLRRLPRGVAPTEAGLALLEEARSVLARAATVEDAVRRAARGEAGRLAVGFTSSAGLHPFVPTAIRYFRRTSPGVRIELDEAGTAELVEAVLAGRLDAAFVRSPVGAVAGLRFEPVLDEPMLVALPEGHALARQQDGPPLLLAALAGEPFVLYRRQTGPGLYDTILAACREAGFTPEVAQEAPRLPATLSLVAAGLGVSVVPASMRRLAVAGVAYRALADSPGPVAPVRLVLRRAGASATASRFADAVARLVADPHAAVA
ncbi:LysR family transcriptional regulator [Paracraurococcus ruber]|uniref:LysR family transcriptional regulator n=1 Tax=Paracraurococcus ruber TaxID=77675 RepID=A0ABS1D135_9PROT|nr:LysR family transcriptional regulator [Paracraurococcus ruber]MBK1660271.1 LysR family transcriptional regulator [Paracraurococcus ruber]TDG28001.1 LysR family transcriptional regulator [Paracraurococcus ruber]